MRRRRRTPGEEGEKQRSTTNNDNAEEEKKERMGNAHHIVYRRTERWSVGAGLEPPHDSRHWKPSSQAGDVKNPSRGQIRR